MAKKVNAAALIEKEIGNFVDKVEEFQRYLKDNDVRGVVSLGDDEFTSAMQDKLHKEILIQIKMQDAILNWLPLLKKLKEDDVVNKETARGGAAVGGMFKNQD